MKIKEQTRKLAAGCSKQCFEVADRTDEVSNHTYRKAKLTRFEEIFEEYKIELLIKKLYTLDGHRANGALFDIEFLVFQDNFTYACKLFEFFDFFWMSDESDNIAFFTHATCTASTVSVGFNISRNIKVYDAF